MSPSERRAAEVGEVHEAASPPEPTSALDSTPDSTLDSTRRTEARRTSRVARPTSTGTSAATSTGTSAATSAATSAGTSAATSSASSAAVRPVDIPQIVPATVDAPAEPEPQRPRRAESPVVVVEQNPQPDRLVTNARHEAIDAWHGTANGPVAVPIPVMGGARAGALRSVGRRPRVRKVTRVVRHIDPWSTFKVGLVFSVVLYGVLLTAGVLLWNVASNTGTVDNVERWFTQFGWESYELKGGEIFHNAWIAGLFGVVGLTGLVVLSATLFNLISDMVGGVRVTVLEEEVIEHTTSRSDRFVVRRPPDGPPPVAEFDLDGDLDGPANGTRRGSTPTSSTPRSG